MRASAQRKAAITEQRAKAALILLIQEQRPITFKAVAQTAGIATAWLYEHEAVKARIIHLRAQQAPKAKSASIMEIDDSLPGNAAHHLVSFA